MRGTGRDTGKDTGRDTGKDTGRDMEKDTGRDMGKDNQGLRPLFLQVKKVEKIISQEWKKPSLYFFVIASSKKIWYFRGVTYHSESSFKFPSA